MGFQTAKCFRHEVTYEDRSSNSNPEIFEVKQFKVFIYNVLFSRIK